MVVRRRFVEAIVPQLLESVILKTIEGGLSFVAGENGLRKEALTRYILCFSTILPRKPKTGKTLLQGENIP